MRVGNMKNNTPQNTESIYINPKAAIAVLVTFVLLVGCLIPMFVGLAMDAFGGGDVDVSDGGSKSNKDKTTQGEKDKPVSVTSKAGEKTGIVLPSPTKAGTYLSANGEGTVDISGDTEIKSAAAVLVDITDNVTVATKAADTKIYPASMTKVMTLLVACENARDPNALLSLTDEMISKYNSAANSGASLAFAWENGYQITVEDVLHMIIYGSDTYACWLIADYVAGSEEAFVNMMNQRASELGLSNTHFANCTGLYNTEHYTTCRDMAAIMAAAMNNEAATAILGRADHYKVDIYEGGENTDNPQGMYAAWYSRFFNYGYSNSAWYYAGKGSDIKFVGGKTGYEDVPMNCFVTAGINDITGRRYVCVQVGRVDNTQASINASTSTYDTRVIYQKYAKENDE